MTKDQAMQLLQSMDDVLVRRKLQQISQRQWDEWGMSISITKLMLLMEIEHHKIGYGDILVIKDRAEQADRLQAELKAKNAVLAYVMEQCEEHTSQYALNVYRAAEAVLSQYRRKEDTNA